MKLTSLSNDLLRYMAKAYSEKHQKIFTIDEFLSSFPDQDKNFISDALFLLGKDGFVSAFSADGIAYSVSILPDAIRSVEEDTFIKKGYTVLKEIRSWL